MSTTTNVKKLTMTYQSILLVKLTTQHLLHVIHVACIVQGDTKNFSFNSPIFQQIIDDVIQNICRVWRCNMTETQNFAIQLPISISIVSSKTKISIKYALFLHIKSERNPT